MPEENVIQTPAQVSNPSTSSSPESTPITQSNQTENNHHQSIEENTVKNPKWNKLSIISFLTLILWIIIFKPLSYPGQLPEFFTFIIFVIAKIFPESIAFILIGITYFLPLFLSLLISYISFTQISKNNEKGKLLSILVMLISAPVSFIIIFFLANILLTLFVGIF